MMRNKHRIEKLEAKTAEGKDTLTLYIPYDLADIIGYEGDIPEGCVVQREFRKVSGKSISTDTMLTKEEYEEIKRNSPDMIDIGED